MSDAIAIRGQRTKWGVVSSVGGRRAERVAAGIAGVDGKCTGGQGQEDAEADLDECKNGILAGNLKAQL